MGAERSSSPWWFLICDVIPGSSDIRARGADLKNNLLQGMCTFTF